jgi:hypothetical protein
MHSTIIALQRRVSGRVAIHAARVHEDRVRRKERLACTGIILATRCLSDIGIYNGRTGSAPSSFELISLNRQKQNASNDYPLQDSSIPVSSMDNGACHDDPPYD